MQRDRAAMDTLVCWVVEAMVLMLTADERRWGRKNYVRVCSSDQRSEIQFWAIDLNKGRSYCKRFTFSPYVNAFSA